MNAARTGRGRELERDVPEPKVLTELRGYERVYHYYDGDDCRFYHHQLIAVANGADPMEVFTGRQHIHHKNGIKWDNRPDNLETHTPEEHGNIHAAQGDYNDNVEYPDEELFSWIEAFVEEIGIVPTYSDLDGWPGPSARTYELRFGTFTKALRAAGYTPRSERGESDD